MILRVDSIWKITFKLLKSYLPSNISKYNSSCFATIRTSEKDWITPEYWVNEGDKPINGQLTPMVDFFAAVDETSIENGNERNEIIDMIMKCRAKIAPQGKKLCFLLKYPYIPEFYDSAVLSYNFILFPNYPYEHYRNYLQRKNNSSCLKKGFIFRPRRG